MSRSLPGLIGLFLAVVVSVFVINKVKFLSDFVYGKSG